MAHGKSESDRDLENTIRNRLPENFWTMDVNKAAALALVEENRTEAHRAHYQIAIDDRDKAEPPSRCTITLSDASARCYNAVDGHYFLRVDPDDCILVFAGSSASGVAFYNAVYDQPVFDLRICPLGYEEARKIAQVDPVARPRPQSRREHRLRQQFCSLDQRRSGHLARRVDGQR